MKQFVMKKQSVDKIKKGNPLLVEQDIQSAAIWQDGDIVELIDGVTGQFLAKALMGKQHRTIGWVFTKHAHETLDGVFFKQQFEHAKMKREKLALNSTAYRLFNGEADGIGGLTIDCYNHIAVFSWYTQALYGYKDVIMDSFQHVYSEIVAIYEKGRFEEATFETQFVTGKQQDTAVITENEVKFATYMNEGLMTGIFLDQREVRNYLKQHTYQQTVLNTFSYTGAFSVAAALGGARQTVSVDVANRSVDKTKEHFALNGIDMAEHRCYVMDVFDYFKYAQRKQLTFDWVVLDPPSFARTKKRTFSVAKNYKTLLQDAIAITAKNGHIVVSTNASNVSVADFEKMIQRAFEELSIAYKVDKIFRLPKDFTTLSAVSTSNYLKVYIVKVMR